MDQISTNLNRRWIENIIEHIEILARFFREVDMRLDTTPLSLMKISRKSAILIVHASASDRLRPGERFLGFPMRPLLYS